MHTLIDSELVTMETSQPLSIESFSYSWLVNMKPSFESLEESLGAFNDDSDGASFIEMDPKLPASRRFFRGSQDFNFDFPTSDSPLTLVHADELISNGFLMPFFVKPLKKEAYQKTSYSTPSTPVTPHAQRNVGSGSEILCSSFRRCRRLSKQILKKSLEFVRPVFQKFRGPRSGSKIGADDDDDDDEKMGEGNKFLHSASTSPRISVAYSVDNWRRSCDSESSIYEAVLHCKRSIGK